METFYILKQKTYFLHFFLKSYAPSTICICKTLALVIVKNTDLLRKTFPKIPLLFDDEDLKANDRFGVEQRWGRTDESRKTRKNNPSIRTIVFLKSEFHINSVYFKFCVQRKLIYSTFLRTIPESEGCSKSSEDELDSDIGKVQENKTFINYPQPHTS